MSDDAPVLPYVPPPPPKTSKAARTRERLLAVAFDLFVVHGYSAVSMRDVASAAGLTKGAVYGHFRSKGQLLVEVIRWRLASGDYSWEHRSRERLRRGGTKMLLGGGQNLGGLLAVDAAAAARHDPDVAAGLAELHAERAERIVAVIQADGMQDPDAVAWVVSVLSAGITMRDASGLPMPDAGRVEAVLDEVFAALRRRGATERPG